MYCYCCWSRPWRGSTDCLSLICCHPSGSSPGRGRSFAAPWGLANCAASHRRLSFVWCRAGDQAYLTLAEHFRVLAKTKPLAEPDNSYLQLAARAGGPRHGLIFLAIASSGILVLVAQLVGYTYTPSPPLSGEDELSALVALSVNSLTALWSDKSN